MLGRYAIRNINKDAPILVSLSTSSARSTALPVGWYIITCGSDCTFLQGGSTVTALTTSRRLWAGTYRYIRVTGSTDAYVAAILGVGTATLSIEQID